MSPWDALGWVLVVGAGVVVASSLLLVGFVLTSAVKSSRNKPHTVQITGGRRDD